MFHLLYKELRLAAHPTLYIFMLLGALVLIPGYPYSVVFLYGCLAPFITFQTGQGNQDAFFTAQLPVQKRDVVKAKCLLLAVTQLGQLVISLPFACLRPLLTPGGNPVGLDANVAYYGFGLMIFAAFNFIFFTEFYKTARKVGKAFFLAIIPAVLGMAAIEVLPHLPATRWLDSMQPALLVKQLPILAVGAAIYLVGMAAAYRIGAKRFERVDL